MKKEMETLLEKIFGSRTRVKLFRLFYTNPEQEHFVREIARIIDEQINSVRRELSNLEKIGILQSEDKDKKKYYRPNTGFVLFEELRSLILKSRMTLEQDFVKSIQNIGSIEYLALAGYFVNDPKSQVDLFIVGNIKRPKLDELLEKFREQFGKQLRFTVMTKDEYQYRKEVTDMFLYTILDSEKIVVVDTMNIHNT